MKQVHWQLPFASLNGTQYRIDIYSDADENANENWPIQLVGAATPFVTDEDNSEDFFAPVRSQTGVIHIVNTGGIVTLEDIIPKTNLDRPVKVVADELGIVVWQGYLSCEAYNQKYTNRPDEIDLPVKSVLEAMKGEQVPYSIANGAELKTIGELLSLTGYEHILIPESLIGNYDDRAIYNYNWVTEGESLNGSIMTRIREGKSIYEMVGDICTMLSLVAREVGDTLWLQDPYAETDTIYKYAGEESSEVVYVQAENIDTLEYQGTGHQYNIRQSAKSVSINSHGKDSKDSFNIVDVPNRYTNPDEITHIADDFVSKGGTTKYIGEMGSDAYKRMPDITFSPRRVYFEPTDNGTSVQYRGEEAEYDQALNVIYQGYNSDMQKLNPTQASGNLVVGIASAKFTLYTGNPKYANAENGLLLTGVNTEYAKSGGFADTEGTDTLPNIASIRIPHTTIDMIGNRGWMQLKVSADFITQNGNQAEGTASHPNILRLSIRHGNLYLHSTVTTVTGSASKKVSYEWNSTSGYAEILMVGGKVLQSENLPEGNYEIGDSLVIPSPYILSGGYIDIVREEEKYMEILISPVISGRKDRNTTPIYGDEARYVHIKKLELSALNTKYYEKPESQRKYRRVLNAGSDEEQSIDMALCSWLTSRWSMLYKVTRDPEDPEVINYKAVSNIIVGNGVEVPEQRLLNRMSSYYSSTRRTLTLEVRLDTIDTFAVYRGYDERDYIVQSMSYDLKNNLVTLKMAER